jgi:hypothetical protein
MVDADVEESLVDADLAMVVTAVKGRWGKDGKGNSQHDPKRAFFTSLSA